MTGNYCPGGHILINLTVEEVNHGGVAREGGKEGGGGRDGGKEGGRNGGKERRMRELKEY